MCYRNLPISAAVDDSEGDSASAAQTTATTATAKSLTYLNLDGAQLLTDSALECLGTHCHALATLKLYGCSRMSGAGLALISDGCHCLREIDLTGIEEIHDSHVSYLESKHPGIQVTRHKFI